MVGRLGPLHEACQALGLSSSGSRLIGHSTHNAPPPTPFFFSIGGLWPSSQGKILCFRTLNMENCKLLIRICSNASVVRDVPRVHSICLLKFLPYIYGGEPPKSMRLSMDFSSVTQSLFPLL